MITTEAHHAVIPPRKLFLFLLEEAEDIDEAAAVEAQQAAERLLSEQTADIEFSSAAAALAEAMARQRTVAELKKRRR